MSVYNRERKLQCGKIAGGIHLLHEMFSSDLKAVAYARGIGLGALNLIGPVKRLIVEEAVGINS